MFGWFNAKEETAFGVSLAKFFMERIPLDSTKKEKSMSKKQEVLTKMFAQIARFKDGHKLNVYKKAKLGNAFAWALKDANYDPVFVDGLTKELLLRL